MARLLLQRYRLPFSLTSVASERCANGGSKLCHNIVPDVPPAVSKAFKFMTCMMDPVAVFGSHNGLRKAPHIRFEPVLTCFVPGGRTKIAHRGRFAVGLSARFVNASRINA
jgi:hypothetical protein